MKGLVIEPENADRFVMHLPDGTYVAVFPTPMCGHRHRDPNEAARCPDVTDKIAGGRFAARPETVKL